MPLLNVREFIKKIVDRIFLWNEELSYFDKKYYLCIYYRSLIPAASPHMYRYSAHLLALVGSPACNSRPPGLDSGMCCSVGRFAVQVPALKTQVVYGVSVTGMLSRRLPQGGGGSAPDGVAVISITLSGRPCSSMWRKIFAGSPWLSTRQLLVVLFGSDVLPVNFDFTRPGRVCSF